MSEQKTNINFFLKKPSKNRRGYGLVKYSSINRWKKEYLPLAPEEQSLIKSINQLFLNNQINQIEVEARFKKFLKVFKQKQGTLKTAFTDSVISDYNHKILNKFWTDKYENKELIDPSSARYDFERALKELATVAVDSDIQSIKRKLSHLSISKIKRIYARLNEIRSYLGLPAEDRLSTNKTEVQEISYISIAELKKMLTNIQNPDIQAAVASLFATGLRLGELLVLSESDYIHGYLNIVKQVRADGTIARPKRNKVGKVIIIDDLKSYVLDFLKIENKQKLRNLIQNTVVDVSNTILKRHIHAHDLRHSHAIYLLNKGASLTLISLQLRNRIEVCQKYYSGFAHTDDTLELLRKIAK